MKLLQVCNVDDICGGTAACAWSIVQSLPGCEHAVAFFNPPTPDTRAAFRRCRIDVVRRLDQLLIQAVDPDVLLLHNTPRARAGGVAAPLTIQYLHSRIDPAPADVTVACSHWLRRQYPAQSVAAVLYQPVCLPEHNGGRRPRPQRDRLTVGRLCTPTPRKWPRTLLPFYRDLTATQPHVEWEFVGCPSDLQDELRQACGGRAAFLPAEPTARRHLLRWDAVLYHHPTLTESFGRVAAEALLAGCIPIVDRRGGFCEQVTPQTGFLCDHPADFAAALSALRAVERRTQLSADAVTTARRRFSTTAFAARFRALLQAMCGPQSLHAPRSAV